MTSVTSEHLKRKFWASVALISCHFLIFSKKQFSSPGFRSRQVWFRMVRPSRALTSASDVLIWDPWAFALKIVFFCIKCRNRYKTSFLDSKIFPFTFIFKIRAINQDNNSSIESRKTLYVENNMTCIRQTRTSFQLFIFTYLYISDKHNIYSKDYFGNIVQFIWRNTKKIEKFSHLYTTRQRREKFHDAPFGPLKLSFWVVPPPHI